MHTCICVYLPFAPCVCESVFNIVCITNYCRPMIMCAHVYLCDIRNDTLGFFSIFNTHHCRTLAMLCLLPSRSSTCGQFVY